METVERIAMGRRLFPDALEKPTPSELFDSLLNSRNWVTLVLTLGLIQQKDTAFADFNRIQALAEHGNTYVSQGAGQLLTAMEKHENGEVSMETAATIPLTEKIFHLKNIEIFADLSVNELAAVASVTKEVVFDDDEIVFREGAQGDTLFLVVEGSVAVIKNRNVGEAIELDSIGSGDYFGEMALFGDERRSATIQVKTASRFLTLQKQELQEIVREFPQIALHVCRVLSMRIRHLHGKISEQVC